MPAFVVEAVVRLFPVERVHDHLLAVARVAGRDLFARPPTEHVVIAEARVPGVFQFARNLLEEADLVLVIVLGGVTAVEDHVAAHEDEIGRGLDRVDGGDAFAVTLRRMPAGRDVLVG